MANGACYERYFQFYVQKDIVVEDLSKEKKN